MTFNLEGLQTSGYFKQGLADAYSHEPHKAAAVVKVVGLTAVLLAAGQVLFVIGKRGAATERSR